MKAESSDGTKIAYRVQGTGRSVLLLHGFGNNQSMWFQSGWVDRLEKDFTVITMDFRGCGESEKPEQSSAYSLSAHLADLDAVISACNASSPVIWGWSIGATVALHNATRAEVAATVAAGTYFGPIFTHSYIESRLSEGPGVIDRARLLGMGTWPGVQPDQIRGRFLVYTGTDDGNVVKQLELQRNSIEAAGGILKVLSETNHPELVTATGKVMAIVLPFVNDLYVDR
jgi:pimeloyl-ACP methyl ester carboxylesterase